MSAVRPILELDSREELLAQMVELEMKGLVLDWNWGEDYVVIVLVTAAYCPCCQKLERLFINRGGATLCLNCDRRAMLVAADWSAVR